MTTVTFYFDFVSPYSYLALTQAHAFREAHRIEFDIRPVVYAKILESHGLLGPVETEAKRRYTFADVLRIAKRLGVPLVGPPAHPFRSLEALRAMTIWRDDPRALDLAVALSFAAWGEGRDLTDVGVIAEVVSSAGFDASSLRDRMTTAAIKDELEQIGFAAIDAGVFGVPTFVVSGELFWGQDRMDHLAEFLEGRAPSVKGEARVLLARPIGADRRR